MAAPDKSVVHTVAGEAVVLLGLVLMVAILVIVAETSHPDVMPIRIVAVLRKNVRLFLGIMWVLGRVLIVF